MNLKINRVTEYNQLFPSHRRSYCTSVEIKLNSLLLVIVQFEHPLTLNLWS